MIAMGGTLGLWSGCTSTGPASRVVSSAPPPAPTVAAGTVPTQPQPAVATVVVAGQPNSYIVMTAPPAPQPEAVPKRPSSQDVWTPGYWTWQNNNYAWMAGHWQVPPTTNAVWVNPRWVTEGNAYRFYDGYWES